MIFESVKEYFPLLRGRSGVEALTRTIPVVFRFYSGGLRVLTYRAKVKCLIEGNQLKVSTRPVSIPYENIGDVVTGITIAFDYPFIERIEAEVPIDGDIELGSHGTISLAPECGCLLALTVADPN